MAQAKMSSDGCWISLVYVIELIFLIKNANDFETRVRKDMKHTQYWRPGRECTTGRWSYNLESFVSALEPSRQEHKLWSQTRRVQSPLCHFQLCALAVFLNLSGSLSSYVKQDNNRKYFAELSRIRVNTYKVLRTMIVQRNPSINLLL